MPPITIHTRSAPWRQVAATGSMRDRERTNFLSATWTTRVGAGEIGSQCAQAPGNTRWGPRTTDRRVIGSRAHAQAAYQVLLHSPPPARETEMRCNATRPSTDRGEVALFARAVRSVQRSPRRKVNTPAPGHVLSHEARAHPLAARCELLGRRPREKKDSTIAELLRTQTGGSRSQPLSLRQVHMKRRDFAISGMK